MQHFALIWIHGNSQMMITHWIRRKAISIWRFFIVARKRMLHCANIASKMSM